MNENAVVLSELFDTTWNLGIIAVSVVALGLSLLLTGIPSQGLAYLALLICASPMVVMVVANLKQGRADGYNIIALIFILAFLAFGSVFGAAAMAFLARLVSSVMAIEGSAVEAACDLNNTTNH